MTYPIPVLHRRGAPRPLALSRPQQQRGIALIVGLVILVVMALLGTAAYSVATQEERMAGNTRDHARAFQAAEFALRQCEQYLLTQNPQFDAVSGYTPGGPGGMYKAPTNGSWWGDRLSNPASTTAPPSLFNPAAMPGAIPLPNVVQQPVCLAEVVPQGITSTKLDPSKPSPVVAHTARITAAGYGINTSTSVVLVSFITFFDSNL